MLLYMIIGKNMLINTQILTVFKKMTTGSIRRNKSNQTKISRSLIKRVQNLSQGMNRNSKNMYGLLFHKELKSTQINSNISMNKSNIHILQHRLISLLVETISRALRWSFWENETGLEYQKMTDVYNRILKVSLKCKENLKFKNDNHS